MKLRYLMLPIIIVSLMFLVLDKETNIENKRVFNENKEITYPYFGTPEIDNYITNYLNDYINIHDNALEVLIDYDYRNTDNLYHITFYKYIFNGNKIIRNTDSILINTKDKTINRTEDVSYEYDIIQNKVIDKENKLIALTFDDGPNYNTNKILDVLEKYNVPATFFILGSKIKGNEYILQRMIKTGNQIGILISNEEEIEHTRNLIFEVTGTYSNLIRTNNYIVNSKIKKVSNNQVITWNIDSLDSNNHNSQEIAERVINKVRDGDIVLMHDIYSATANALNIIIPELQSRGFSFVTVSELFYYKGIELEEGKVYGYAK